MDKLGKESLTADTDDVDVEAGGVDNVVFNDLDFTEKTIRQGFIRKVYGILMAQLAVTVAICLVFILVEPVKMFVQTQAMPFLLAGSILTCFVILIIFCSKKARRRSPGNYIFLAIFTVALGLDVGVICSVSEKQEVLLALVFTTVLCLALTLFAFQTRIDFTTLHAGLFSLLVALTMMGIAFWFIQPPQALHMVFAGLGAFVFSLLLIHDTQIIIGGKHALAISPEEYVFAALTIYLDIINMFLRILRIIRLV